MLSVNPRLPLTTRKVPASEALEPNPELPIDELPKCEAAIFNTARFGEIAELRTDNPAIPRAEEPEDIEAPPILGAREFHVIFGPVVPADSVRADPATGELPEFPSVRSVNRFPTL